MDGIDLHLYISEVENHANVRKAWRRFQLSTSVHSLEPQPPIEQNQLIEHDSINMPPFRASQILRSGGGDHEIGKYGV